MKKTAIIIILAFLASVSLADSASAKSRRVNSHPLTTTVGDEIWTFEVSGHPETRKQVRRQYTEFSPAPKDRIVTRVVQVAEIDWRNTKLYRIQPGDTLDQLAAEQATTPRAIQQLNPKKIRNVNRIFAGQEIILPVAPDQTWEVRLAKSLEEVRSDHTVLVKSYDGVIKELNDVKDENYRLRNDLKVTRENLKLARAELKDLNDKLSASSANGAKKHKIDKPETPDADEPDAAPLNPASSGQHSFGWLAGLSVVGLKAILSFFA